MLGGMGVQRLMTLGNQSSSPLQMGTRGGRDLPTSRGDEDPSWRWEDPPPPGGGSCCYSTIAFIITDHHINREFIPPGIGKIHLPPAATISMLSHGINEGVVLYIIVLSVQKLCYNQKTKKYSVFSLAECEFAQSYVICSLIGRCQTKYSGRLCQANRCCSCEEQGQ